MGSEHRPCFVLYGNLRYQHEFDRIPNRTSRESSLPLPPEVVAQLPKTGRATVVLRIQDDPDDAQWRRAAYEQFMKDDDSEDAVCDSYQ